MRVATIDIGTNAVLLLVAESRPDGSTRAVVDRATITRLGEGVDRSRTLSPAAVARTRSCLETYATLARAQTPSFNLDALSKEVVKQLRGRLLV